MRQSTRPGEQSGQMLVAVIVLLAMMFFIGSAMALAVSSSLHTIAQTNNSDSRAYGAEAAVAQGLAGNQRQLPFTVGRSGAAGTTKWSYSFEVIAGSGVLAGRSQEQSDTAGYSALDSTNYEVITIDPPVPGAARFEVFRTAVGAGGNPGTTGYIGNVTANPSGPTVLNDMGLVVGDPTRTVTPADANCNSHTLSSLAPARNVNGFALKTSTCRVPVDPGPGAVHMWSAPGQRLPAGSQAAVPLTIASPGNCNAISSGSVPGTIWGVIGWSSLSSGTPANLNIYVDSAEILGSGSCPGTDVDPCPTPEPISDTGLLYFYCHMDSPSPATNNHPVAYKTLHVRAAGGGANVGAFIVRAAASGTDCIATTIGQAKQVTNEADWQMPGCAWANATPTLWNRVLP
jgi:hypothetical protein